MIPRWITARAVSGLADLMLRVVSPTLVPSKESTGSVASSERITAVVHLRRWAFGGLIKREVEGV